MKIKNYLILFLLIISYNTVFSKALKAHESVHSIQFMTENYPPYNYFEGNQIKGIFIDVLLEISSRMGKPMRSEDIDLLPWARAYRSVLKNKKKCLFGMARSEDRETLFKWAGPVSQSRSVLIARKENSLNITSINDLRHLKIGVVKDDVHAKILMNRGVKKENLIYSFGETAVNEILKELNKGLIDLWAYGETAARWQIKKTPFNEKDYKIIYVLESTKGYFAFSLDVSDMFVSSFQKKLNEIMTDGTYQKIIDGYLSEDFRSQQ